MHRFFTAILALGFAISTSSCSIGFNHEWEQAAASTQTTAPRNLEGAWLGTWRSEADGHHGVLRAVVTAVPGKETPSDYDFRYHATYKTVLSGTYTTRHHVDDRGTLSGSHDLGGMGGWVFTYEGKVTPTDFRATYKSSSDHGVFEMKRP